VVGRPAEKIEDLLWALAFVAQPFGNEARVQFVDAQQANPYGDKTNQKD
jgi:NTP pyrophosphatase (non-canonical NTP hydrolase)